MWSAVSENLDKSKNFAHENRALVENLRVPNPNKVNSWYQIADYVWEVRFH